MSRLRPDAARLRRSPPRQAWLAMAGVAAWIIAWWGVVAVFKVPQEFLPSPWQVVEKIIWLATDGIGEGKLWLHMGWSLLRFLSGFLLATALGVPLGLLMGHFRPARDMLNPLFELLRNVPPIAWAPFSLLWFGASFGSQAFVIFVAAFPPILLNTQQGVRLTDKGLISAARMLGAGSLTLLFEIGLPAAAPSVIAGLRIGLANGWLALVGAEIIAGPGALTGLGFLVLVGQQNLQATIAIGAMALIGIIGASFDYALCRLETMVARGA